MLGWRASARAGSAARCELRLDGPAATVLERLQTNCFVADLDRTIVYANPSARATMSSLPPDTSRVFSLALKQVIGRPIHRCHQDPARSARRDPSAPPCKAVFGIGDVTLKMTIFTITDPAGNGHGYVVTWQIVTPHDNRADVRTAVAATTIETYSAQVCETAHHIAPTARPVGQYGKATSNGLEPV